MAEYIETSLKDEKYFELFIGKRVLKKDIRNSMGKIPIYSANVFSPIGFSSKSNIKDFSNNFIIWGIDGDFEFNLINANTSFVSTDHCGAIRIKNKDILPEYLLYYLYSVKSDYGFDREWRASLTNMKRIKIKIPVKKGKIDVEKQKDIAKKYELINDFKKKLTDYNTQLQNINVFVTESNKDVKSISVLDKEVFKLTRGKRITKKTINANKGDIIVYSSSKDENLILGKISEDYIKKNNLILFTEPSVLINIDGSVGYCFVRKNDKYSFIDVVASIIPLSKNIDLNFLKNALETEIRASGANYDTKLYFNKMKSQDIRINIPLDNKGEFDLKTQKKIADRYQNIKTIKENIRNQLNAILNSRIDIQ